MFSIAPYRLLISRCIIGFALIFLFIRGMENLLPYQLLQPAIPRATYDFTDWFFKLSGLSYWLVQNPPTAVLFTVLLFITGLLAWWQPRVRVFVISFTVLYFLYTLSFTIYLTHKAHLNAVMTWALIACWPKRDETFQITWEGFRYFALWPFASTFLLKLINGAFWQTAFGELSVKGNLADYLFYFPDTWFAQLCSWLVRHPSMLDVGAKLFMLCEGFFILGYFTRKFDRWFILLAVLILFQTYLFADVLFAEMLVMVFAFFPEAWWERLYRFTTPAGIHNLFTSSKK